jgi:hypothetical protein
MAWTGGRQVLILSIDLTCKKAPDIRGFFIGLIRAPRPVTPGYRPHGTDRVRRESEFGGCVAIFGSAFANCV